MQHGESRILRIVPVKRSIPAKAYEALESGVLLFRLCGVASDVVEDPIMERMEEHWWEMNEEERDEANARARARRVPDHVSTYLSFILLHLYDVLDGTLPDDGMLDIAGFCWPVMSEDQRRQVCELLGIGGLR